MDHGLQFFSVKISHHKKRDSRSIKFEYKFYGEVVILSAAKNDLEKPCDERPAVKNWSLYIIECRKGELYVGIAEDVNKRVAQHNQGRACRYTKFRWPVRLLYQEACGGYADARKREREVKKFSREKKLALRDLSSQKA